MAQATNIVALANAIGGDIGAILASIGSLENLTTVDKTNLVAALNELKVSVGESGVGGAQINDATASTTSVYSSTKVVSAINAAIAGVVDSAPETFNTLKEIADWIANDTTAASAMTTAINNRVRYDATQTLTTAQQLQACNNIGIGNPETDFVASYNTAKA